MQPNKTKLLIMDLIHTTTNAISNLKSRFYFMIQGADLGTKLRGVHQVMRYWSHIHLSTLLTFGSLSQELSR